jgi:hypothetical protein
VLLVAIGAALAHPDASPSAADAVERAADDAFLGPPGCWEADVAVALTLDGAAVTGPAVLRLDDRRWQLVSLALSAEDPRHADVRVAPMMLGLAIDADLRWPLGGGRTLAWPAPVATMPRRLAGEVETVAVDRLSDRTVVVRSFAWDGWKRVAGARRAELDADGRPVVAALEATDRWPGGCVVALAGRAELDPRGLPRLETWDLRRRCPLSRSTQRWEFAFSPWRSCVSR